MKKKVTRLISAVLSVAMTLTAVPVTAFADGEVHTHDSESNVITTPLDFRTMTADDSGEGWSWVNDTKTLTLDGANIQATTDSMSVITVPDGTEIVLNGENTIVQTDTGESYTYVLSAVNTDTVNCDGTMTISGDGVLNAENRSTDSMMRSLGGTIIINGGTVNATGKVVAESLEIHNDGVLNANASATSFDGTAVNVGGSITVDGNGSLNAVGCAIEDEDIMNSAISLTGNQDNKISVSGNGSITAPESNGARYGICYNVDRKRINAEISGGKVTAYGTLCGISSINLIMSGSGSVYATGGMLGIDNTNPSIDEDEFVIKGSTEFKAEENAVTDKVEYYNNWYRIGEENAKTVVIKPDTSPRIILGKQTGRFTVESGMLYEGVTLDYLVGTVSFDILPLNISDEDFASATAVISNDNFNAEIRKNGDDWICTVSSPDPYDYTYYENAEDEDLYITYGDIKSNTQTVIVNQSYYAGMDVRVRQQCSKLYTNAPDSEKQNYYATVSCSTTDGTVKNIWYVNANSKYTLDQLGEVSEDGEKFKISDNAPIGNFAVYCDTVLTKTDGTESILTNKFSFEKKECKHENGYDFLGKCNDCRSECPHDDVDIDTGKCTKCEYQLAAIIVKDGAIDSVYKDTNMGAAFETADSADNKGCTLKLFRQYTGDYTTLTGEFTLWLDTSVGFNTFTVSENGNITVKNRKLQGQNIGNFIVGDSGKLTFVKTNRVCGTVTVDAGTFDCYDANGIDLIISNENSNVTLYGGYFTGISYTGGGDRENTGILSLLAENCAFYQNTALIDCSSTTLGDGLSSATFVVSHKHSYDIETGKCVCGKLCDHADIDTETGICKTCKHEFVATLSTDGNAPTGFDSLQTCLDSVTADTENYVKLYRDIEYDTTTYFTLKYSVTIDLNGHRLDNMLMFNRNNGKLALTGTKGSYVQQVNAYNRFTIDSKSSIEFGAIVINAGTEFVISNGADVTVDDLTVFQLFTDTGAATSVTLATGMKIVSSLRYRLNNSSGTDSIMLKDLLADNQALQYDESGELVDLYQKFTGYTISDKVIVVEHSHAFDSTTGKCDCGYACEHNDVDIETGICSVCKLQFTASISGVSGKATEYFDNIDKAFNTADSASLKGCTLAIYKDCELTDTVNLKGNQIINVNFGGHTIKGNVNVLAAEITLKLTGGGNFNGKITIWDSSTLINGVNDTNDSKAVSIKELCVESNSPLVTHVELYGGAYDSFIFNGDLADVAIYGGNFGEIKSEYNTSIAVGTLLAENRAFVRTLPAELIDGSAVTLYDGLTNVSVVEHEHRYNVETGKCPCGVCALAIFTETTLSTVTYTFIESITQLRDIAEDATDGVLKLTDDIDGIAQFIIINGNKTIDMNGHTLKFSTGTSSLSTWITINGIATFENSASTRAVLDVSNIFCHGIATINGDIKFNYLQIEDGDAVINAGVFKSISVQEERSVIEILGSGKALASESTGDILNASNNEVNITNDNIIVIDHPKHTYDDHGNCACGYKCLHDGEGQVDEDSTNIVCSECGAKIYAKVTVTGGDVRYFDDIVEGLLYADMAENKGCVFTVVTTGGLENDITLSSGQFTINAIDDNYINAYTRKINIKGAEITVENCAFNCFIALYSGSLTYPEGSISVCNNGINVYGGTLNISDGVSENCGANHFTISSTATDVKVTIGGGTFNEINLGQYTLMEILASGTCLISVEYSQDTDEIIATNKLLYSEVSGLSTFGADDDKDYRLVKCDHKNDDGSFAFNDSGNICKYCNTEFAASVSYTTDDGEKTELFADIFDAFDKANEVGTATVTLQKNITGTLSRAIESKGDNITLDLNGKKITANYDGVYTVDAKSGKLTIIGEGQSSLNYVTVYDGANVEIQGGVYTSLKVKDGGNAELKGGRFGGVSVSGEGRTLEELLAYGYGYMNFLDVTWVTVANREKQTIANVSIKEAPIKSASIAWYYEESPVVYRNGAKAIQLNATYELADTSKQITYSDFANGNKVRSNYLLGLNEIGPYYAVMGTEIGQSVAEDGKIEYYTVFKCNGYEYKSNSLQFTLETCPHENLVTENGVVTCDTCGFCLIAQVETADGEVTYYDDITKAATAAAENEGSTLKLVSRDQTGDTVTISGGKFTVDLAGVPALYEFNITGGDVTFKSSEEFRSSDLCNITVNGYSAKVTIDGKIELETVELSGGTFTTNNTEADINELLINDGKADIDGAHISTITINGGNTVIKDVVANTLSMDGSWLGNISIVSGRFQIVTFFGYTLGKAIASGSRVIGNNMSGAILYKYADIQSMTEASDIIVEKCDHKDKYGYAAVSNNACLYCNSLIVATVTYTVDGDEKADAFTDIYAAFDKANEAGTATVKLYRDIADSELTRDITVTGDVTLELNGHNLMSGYYMRTITVDDGGKLTVNGDGDMEMSINVNKNSKLVINGGGYIYSVTVNKEGNAEIGGGNIEYLAVSGNAKLSGGKFDLIDIFNGNLESVLADGYAYKKTTSGTWVSIADRENTSISSVTVTEAPVLSAELEADKTKIYRNGAGKVIFSIITTMRDGNTVSDDNPLSGQGHTTRAVFGAEQLSSTASISGEASCSYLGMLVNDGEVVEVYYIVSYNGYELRTNTVTIEVATCDHPADKVVSSADGNLICGECESIIYAEIINGDSIKCYTDFEEAMEDAQLEENEGCTVMVTSDTSGINYITLYSGQFTLDLAGHKVEFIEDRIITTTGADVTIKDSVGGGIIRSGEGIARVITAQNDGKVTLEGGTIANNVYISSGKLDMCGATVENTVEIGANAQEVIIRDGSVIKGTLDVYANADPTHIKLSGGWYAYTSVACSDFAQVLVKDKRLLKDSGGYYSYSELCDSACKPEKFTIVDCDHKEADGNIAFDSDYACEYCGTKFVARVRYTVDGTNVAEYFESIYEAFDKANEAGTATVTLCRDIENSKLTQGFTVTGNVTLELNGKKLGESFAFKAPIEVSDGGMLTVDGEGNMQTPIKVNENSKLIVNGGEFALMMIYKDADAVIGGGVIDDLTVFGNTKLSGGKFYKIQIANGGLESVLADGYAYKIDGGAWLSIAERANGIYRSSNNDDKPVTVEEAPIKSTTLNAEINKLYRNSNNDPTVKFNIIIDFTENLFEDGTGTRIDLRYVINSNETPNEENIPIWSADYEDDLKSSEILTLAGDSNVAEVYYIVTYDGYEVKTNTVSIDLVDCEHSQVVDPTTVENSGGNIEATTYCEICKTQFYAKITKGDDVRYYNDPDEAVRDAQESENEGCTLYPLYNKYGYGGQIVITEGDFTLKYAVRTAFSTPVVINGKVKLTVTGRSALTVFEDQDAFTVYGGNVIFDRLATDGNVTINGGNVTMTGNNIKRLTIKGGDVSISGGQFAQFDVTAEGKVMADYIAKGFWVQDRETKEWIDIYSLKKATAVSEYNGFTVRLCPMQITQPEDTVYYTNGYYPNGIPSLEVDAMALYTTEVNPAIAYQWFSVDENGNETEIEGATGKTLSLENLTTGKYYCRLTYSNATTAGVSVKSDIVTATITECKHTGGEADCTNKAVCEICNAEYGEPLGHDYVVIETVKPTYDSIGYSVFECSRCSDTYIGAYVPVKPIPDVTGIRLEKTAYDEAIVSWDAIDGVSGYYVECYVGGQWMPVDYEIATDGVFTRINGLSAGLTYKVRIKAYAGSYTGKYEYVYVDTVPSPVWEVKMLTATDSSVRVSWNRNTRADGYRVEWYINNEWSVKDISGNENVAATIDGLEAGSQYKVRVSAYRGELSSPYTYGYINTLPSEVTGITQTATTSTITLTWDKNNSADGYIVEYYANGKWNTKTLTGKDTTTLTITRLKGYSTYKMRIKAYKGELVSGYSDIYANTAPTQVSGLKVKSAVDSKAVVTWIADSNADGYNVEYYIGGKWVQQNITGNNTTTAELDGLTPYSTYKVRVRAYKGELYGDYSYITVTTALSSVTGIKTVSASKTSVTVAWDKNNSADGYKAEIYTGGKWVEKTVKGSANAAVTIGGLKAGSVYKVRIASYKGANTSAYTYTNVTTAK